MTLILYKMMKHNIANLTYSPLRMRLSSYFDSLYLEETFESTICKLAPRSSIYLYEKTYEIS